MKKRYAIKNHPKLLYVFFSNCLVFFSNCQQSTIIYFLSCLPFRIHFSLMNSRKHSVQQKTTFRCAIWSYLEKIEALVLKVVQIKARWLRWKPVLVLCTYMWIFILTRPFTTLIYVPALDVGVAVLTHVHLTPPPLSTLCNNAIDAESGKSQDSYTCSATNALPGHALTFARYVGGWKSQKCSSIYGIYNVRVKATSIYHCLDSAVFGYKGYVCC